MRKPFVGSYRQFIEAYGQRGIPTDPYAIIHRNGADCQIPCVASQRRAWLNQAARRRRAEAVRTRYAFACPGSAVMPALVLLVVAHLLERSADRLTLAAIIAIFLGVLILVIGAAFAIPLAAAAKFREQIFNSCIAGEGFLRLVG